MPVVSPPRRARLFVNVAIVASLGIAPALADMTVLTYNTRFCPSWAEAHERSLASLNHGRPPYPVKWKGCIVVMRGTCVAWSSSRTNRLKLSSAASIGSRTRCRTSLRAGPARRQARREKRLSSDYGFRVRALRRATCKDATPADAVSSLRLTATGRYSALIRNPNRSLGIILRPAAALRPSRDRSTLPNRYFQYSLTRSPGLHAVRSFELASFFTALVRP